MQFEVSDFELDAIQETAKIAGQNASIALSNLFTRKVEFYIPDVKIIPASQLSRAVIGPLSMILGVYSKITQGVKGNALILFPWESASLIIAGFKKSAYENILTEPDKLLFKKIATTLYSSYMTSFAKFFEENVQFTSPKIISISGDSVSDLMMFELDDKDDVLISTAVFEIAETNIKGEIILLITSPSLIPQLTKLRKKMGI